MDHWSNFFPIVFLPLKLIALGVCGYFAIKWHFDKEKKRKDAEEKAASIDEIKNTETGEL